MAGFQQVKVFRDLEFLGNASYNKNIMGYPMSDKVVFDDHFVADCDENDWVETVYGATIAHGPGLGGVTTITGGGAANDCGELTHDAMWSAAKNCVIQVRLKVSVITEIAIAVGWADARHNVNNEIAFELDSSNALVDVRATDGAAFVFDTDAGTDVWYCAAVDGDAEGTPVAATGTRVPVADTYCYLRVALNSDGDATFYFANDLSTAGSPQNLVQVGLLPACLSPAITDLMTPYVGFIAHTSATVLTVDRITMWQDE